MSEGTSPILWLVVLIVAFITIGLALLIGEFNSVSFVLMLVFTVAIVVLKISSKLNK